MVKSSPVLHPRMDVVMLGRLAGGERRAAGVALERAVAAVAMLERLAGGERTN